MIIFFFAGQDMDLLALLDSFGLDRMNIAKALGMDIDQLNSMDKEILIHMLTSHKNTD